MKAFEIAVLLLALAVLLGMGMGVVAGMTSDNARKANAEQWQADRKAAQHALMCKQFPDLKVCK